MTKLSVITWFAICVCFPCSLVPVVVVWSCCRLARVVIIFLVYTINYPQQGASLVDFRLETYLFSFASNASF